MAKSRITEWSQLKAKINSLTSRPRVRAVPRCKINRAPSSPTSNIAIGLTAISAVSAPVFQPALQATSNFLPSSSTALSCEALGTCAQATGFVWPSTSTVVFSSLAFAVGITAATFAFCASRHRRRSPITPIQQPLQDGAVNLPSPVGNVARVLNFNDEAAAGQAVAAQQAISNNQKNKRGHSDGVVRSRKKRSIGSREMKALGL